MLQGSSVKDEIRLVRFYDAADRVLAMRGVVDWLSGYSPVTR